MSEGKAKKSAMSAMDRRERALWLKLAKAWDRPKRDLFGSLHLVMAGRSIYGLCGGISVNLPHGELRERMEFKVDAAWDSRPQRQKCCGNYPYYWPSTTRGAKSRAAFCRKMAGLLERGR